MNVKFVVFLSLCICWRTYTTKFYPILLFPLLFKNHLASVVEQLIWNCDFQTFDFDHRNNMQKLSYLSRNISTILIRGREWKKNLSIFHQINQNLLYIYTIAYTNLCLFILCYRPCFLNFVLDLVINSSGFMFCN